MTAYPDAITRANCSSSASTTLLTRSADSFNSGYATCISSRTANTISCMNGFSCPSSRPCRIPRRRIFRSTYPRPSFAGITPSEIRNVAARAWSAIIRSEAPSPYPSASACDPHGRSVSSFARAISGVNRSVSIVRQHTLQHARNPLQPHPRIDRWLRQRSQRRHRCRGRTA